MAFSVVVPIGSGSRWWLPSLTRAWAKGAGVVDRRREDLVVMSMSGWSESRETAGAGGGGATPAGHVGELGEEEEIRAGEGHE